MKWISKTILLGVSVFLLIALHTSGCASKPDDFRRASAVDRVMDSWVGHYQSELTGCWGPPTKIVPDGESGSIIVYESLKGTWGHLKDERLVGGGQYPTEPRQPGYAAQRLFYVNEKGIIDAWKWSGL